VGISESCELLSIKRTFLYKLIAEEKLRPVKLGRRTVFRYADLVAFADEAGRAAA
jgi:excisionase family DNA binding protein